jgi:putative FmdB family regulatory protein
MPIYEYQCKACGKGFETLVSRHSDPVPPCPNCKSKQVTKQFSSFSATVATSSSDSCSLGRCPSGTCAGGGCPLG